MHTILAILETTDDKKHGVCIGSFGGHIFLTYFTGPWEKGGHDSLGPRSVRKFRQ